MYSQGTAGETSQTNDLRLLRVFRAVVACGGFRRLRSLS